MALTAQLSRQVASDVQRRGRQYYASGAVSIVDGNDWSVRAVVQGTEDYEVSLTCDRQRLKVFCSCPYYQDRLEPCKHIWATVLAAEPRGFLRGPGGMAHLRVVADHEALERWDQENGWAADPDEWDEDDDWKEPTSSRGAYSYPRPH